MDNCVSPPALDDQQLLAYLDGEGNQSIGAHLEKCPSCRERAGEIARLQNKLTARLYRLTCPSPIELGDYQMGLLPSSQRMAIAQHLRECPHCMRELAQLRSYLSELAPPPRTSILEGVRVLVARLTGEGGRAAGGTTLAPAYAGLRGGSPGANHPGSGRGHDHPGYPTGSGGPCRHQRAGGCRRARCLDRRTGGAAPGRREFPDDQPGRAGVFPVRRRRPRRG